MDTFATPDAGPLDADPLDTGPLDAGITVTDNAVKRLRTLIATEGNDNLKFRITVSGGGCSGFQYGFSFDETANADDHVFEKNGIQVLVDGISLQYLNGAALEFKEELIGSYFTIENPNASSTCGCGTSFSL